MAPLAALAAPYLLELAKNGLGMLAGAIQAKGKEVIEEKIGVKIPDDPAKLTPELLADLQKRQMDNEEFLIQAAIEEKKLDIENTKDARAMQVAAFQQDDPLPKRFVYYFATGWSLFSGVYIFWITFGSIPANNVRFADTILGFLLGTLIATLMNFFFGSSQGSVKAQQLMRDLARGNGK